MNKTIHTMARAGNVQKVKPASNIHPGKIPGNNGRPTARASVNKSPLGDELTRLRMALGELQRMQTEVRRDLGIVRRIRVEAEKYQQGIEARARSQAQMFLLQTRLETKKEIAELQSAYGEQMQKILSDLRMIRITAQEELETQRKFTDATRIRALSFACQADTEQLLQDKE